MCIRDRPCSPPPDSSNSAGSEQAGDVLSVVHRFFHHDGLFAPRGAIWSASRTYPTTQRRSGTVANAARCGAAPRASGRRVKARNSCRGMPAFGQPFCASVQEIVWDLPTSLPDSAARGDRQSPFVRNEQLARGNCGADRIYRSSRSYPDICERCWRDTGEVAARARTPQDVCRNRRTAILSLKRIDPRSALEAGIHKSGPCLQ